MGRRRASGTVAAFVGRRQELRRIALLAKEQRTALVWVHGPGGIGKTSLLREAERHLVAAGRPVALVRVDQLEPSPAQLVCAFATALGVRPPARLRALLGHRARPILMLDAFEVAAALEGWLADEMSAAGESGGLVVVASRDAPSREWRGPGLAERVHAMPLENFNPAECETFLRGSGIARRHHARLASFTGGHPLALAVVAEDPDGALPTSAGAPKPDLLRALLDGLVERSLTERQRRALESATVVPALTQSMLQHLTSDGEALATFRWLQRRPYVRCSPEGIVVHDLVRDVVESELRWREPDRHAALSARAVERYCDELGRGELASRMRASVSALAWMFCRQPSIRRTFEAAAHDLYVDELRDDDVPVLARLVDEVDGAGARRAWERSLAWQRGATTVARDARRRPRGMWVELVLAPGEIPADHECDPAIAIAHAEMSRLGLAPHERGSLQRLQLDCATRRDIGPTIQLRVAHDARVLLTTPNLAVRWIVAPSGFRWARVWESRGYVELPRPFEMSGKAFSLWQLDLRGTRTAQYVCAAYAGAGAVRSLPSNTEIATVGLGDLRAALRAARDPKAFARTSFAARFTGHGAPGEVAFRRTVERELAAMATTSRGARWKSAIEATYLAPRGDKQEAIAEALGLPFRTYRDNLTHGLAELARRLSEDAPRAAAATGAT
ncbi:MAG: ATP-binding protein [Labilithrix sp.]|nr:ATP-binding protein [Labilithrix sp.]MCW5809426.1 ATP-binding protein [Labilithrix sp.]